VNKARATATPIIAIGNFATKGGFFILANSASHLMKDGACRYNWDQ
jgi:hypothetical protein